MDVSFLPSVNAMLNATATVLLLLGFHAIYHRRIRRHAAFMISALAVSVLFMTSYSIYHAYAGHTTFSGTGWVRPVYFFVLITHVVLATAIVPLVLVTVIRAARRRFERHARIARWTWPLWLYVSVTGVAVYIMLYHLYPARS